MEHCWIVGIANPVCQTGNMALKTPSPGPLPQNNGSVRYRM